MLLFEALADVGRRKATASDEFLFEMNLHRVSTLTEMYSLAWKPRVAHGGITESFDSSCLH